MVCRILVADDSSTIQKVIRIGLAALQTDIKPAGSLMEASKAVDQGGFDLIIADAGLTGVSAASDFVDLANRAGRVPLIILMGSYEAVKEADLRAVGISHIIKKPFPPGELPKLVEQLSTTAKVPTSQEKNSSGRGPVSAVSQQPQKDLPRANVGDIPSFLLSDDGAPLQEGRLDSTQSGVSAVLSVPEQFLPKGMPPLPEIEPARRGRPAFVPQQAGEASTPGGQFPPSKPAHPEHAGEPLGTPLSRPSLSSQSEALDSRHQLVLSAAVEAFVRDELPALVNKAVERYCSEHFKGIARDVLTSELRRLAEEKARYLVDQ
jgi:CheY-like chemotaxis protein